MRELLTVRETAAYLQMHPTSVREKIKAGELRALRLGTGPKAPIRIDVRELEVYLDRCSGLVEGTS